MASKSTHDFRAMLSNQPTAWLYACIHDWKKNGTENIKSETVRCRIMALVRAELLQRHVNVPYVEVNAETAYGFTQRITPVRVF